MARSSDKTKPVSHGGREDIVRVHVEQGILHDSVLSGTLFLINVNSWNSGAFNGMLTGFPYDTSLVYCLFVYKWELSKYYVMQTTLL